MDLEQMKSNWNKVSAQLEKNNAINTRIVHELITNRNQTNFDKIARGHKFILGTLVLMATLALPFQMRTELIHVSSFILIEVVLFATIALTSYMLKVLSRVDCSKRTSELIMRDIVTYKRLYSMNQRFGGAIAVVVIGIVYAIECAFTANAIIAVVITLIAGSILGINQTKRHNRLLKDIEDGLAELREFN